MATRFIDTEIWKEDWFCDLGNEYQAFWIYITCHCDNAGIWKPNKIDFEIKSRIKINMAAFLDKVNERGCKDRIIITDSGRWFLTGFIAFQWFNKTKSYNLVLTNKLHLHIYNLLTKEGIVRENVRGLKEVLVGVSKTPRVKDNIDTINSFNSNSLKEEEDNNRGLGEVLERSESFLIPQMLSMWTSLQPKYPVNEEKDFLALGEISRFIQQQEKIPKGHATDPGAIDKTKNAFQILIEHVSKHNFFSRYSLSQVSTHFQAIVQDLNQSNGEQSSNSKNRPKVDLHSAFEKLNKFAD